MTMYFNGTFDRCMTVPRKAVATTGAGEAGGIKNIELRMYVTNAETGGFHTKGYIFRKEEIYRIIIGSSNMDTQCHYKE